MSESDISKEIELDIGHGPTRLFRNQVGKGWYGEDTRGPAHYSMRLNAGDVLVRNARFLSAGLHKASPDLVGWHTVTITEDMVGRQVAVFVGLEVKVQGKDARPDQAQFIKQIRDAGGISGVVRSSGDAKQIIQQWEDGR